MEDKTEKNKNYHLGEVEKEAFRVFLMTRMEPTDILGVVVPPREYNDSKVVNAMEVELDKMEESLSRNY